MSDDVREINSPSPCLECGGTMYLQRVRIADKRAVASTDDAAQDYELGYVCEHGHVAPACGDCGSTRTIVYEVAADRSTVTVDCGDCLGRTTVPLTH